MVKFRPEGKLTSFEKDEIERILKSNRSYHSKYKEIEYLNILNDHGLTNKTELYIINKIYKNLIQQSDYEDELENNSYAEDLAIPVTDPDDLFGDRYNKLEQRYITRLRIQKINKLKKLNQLNNKRTDKRNGICNNKSPIIIPQSFVGMV
jgi:hypothetical protein